MTEIGSFEATYKDKSYTSGINYKPDVKSLQPVFTAAGTAG